MKITIDKYENGWTVTYPNDSYGHLRTKLFLTGEKTPMIEFIRQVVGKG
jgi:hypothetical protein